MVELSSLQTMAIATGTPPGLFDRLMIHSYHYDICLTDVYRYENDVVNTRALAESHRVSQFLRPKTVLYMGIATKHQKQDIRQSEGRWRQDC